MRTGQRHHYACGFHLIQGCAPESRTSFICYLGNIWLTTCQPLMLDSFGFLQRRKSGCYRRSCDSDTQMRHIHESAGISALVVMPLSFLSSHRIRLRFHRSGCVRPRQSAKQHPTGPNRLRQKVVHSASVRLSCVEPAFHYGCNLLRRFRLPLSCAWLSLRPRFCSSVSHLSVTFQSAPEGKLA